MVTTVLGLIPSRAAARSGRLPRRFGQQSPAGRASERLPEPAPREGDERSAVSGLRGVR
jgi:hypothetical protein